MCRACEFWAHQAAMNMERASRWIADAKEYQKLIETECEDKK